MPLVNSNTNTIPSHKNVQGSGSTPPPPTPTVNWKMLLASADGAAHIIQGFTLNTTGPAGTNDIVTATKGAIVPVSWTVSSAAQAAIGFDFGGVTFTVPSTGEVEALLLEMANTNIIPVGTFGAGPTLTLSEPSGSNLNVNVYVQTTGSAAPGIQTQIAASPVAVNAYLIQQ